MENAKRKSTKTGNSLGVTIPEELLAQVGFKQGDDVRLEAKDGTIRLVKNRKTVLPKDVSKDFFDILNETIADYDKTIRGLADR
ncbi:AbrB/MazE/SpoVT family DNA-binding domain-containing protein [Planococcus lenghuensis]|nr:AbrB/MazE/SpoVT family DNA-binding domain-containing protein [Planococcus lenghuensis]